MALYNTETGEFRGLQEWLAYIMVRDDDDDDDEVFLSYEYNEDKSNELCSSFKEILTNIFQDTSFKNSSNDQFKNI